MAEKTIEEIQNELLKTGRAVIGAKGFERVKIEKNVRYVYNPNPYLVGISALGIFIRPGEVVDLVQVVGSPEKVFSTQEVINATNSGLLIGFTTLDEFAKSYESLAKPDATPPIERLKETGIAIGPEGIERVAEEVNPVENPFTEALVEEYQKEQAEIENLESQAVKKTKRVKKSA